MNINICCMCVYLYIQNKYTQYTNILCKQKRILDAIKRLTSLYNFYIIYYIYIYIYIYLYLQINSNYIYANFILNINILNIFYILKYWKIKINITLKVERLYKTLFIAKLKLLLI